jgi:transposase
MEVRMSQERLSMRKAREILRLRLGLGLSAREVARSCKISHSTVLEYERRARSAGLGWPLPDEIDDTQLEKIVCGPPPQRSGQREMPEIGYLAAEMKKRHVTLHLLWLEYKDDHPDGYQYTQFCEYYRREKKKLDVVLRQEHRAGEKLFTDYAGDTVDIIDPATGQLTPAYIFVAVLGASNYTFAEAVDDLSLRSWISSHIRALEFFGAAPQIIIPDNTKCAVIKPDRYEPDLNPAFAAMAAHYSTAVIPTRVAKPRDKAPAEAGA